MTILIADEDLDLAIDDDGRLWELADDDTWRPTTAVTDLDDRERRALAAARTARDERCQVVDLVYFRPCGLPRSRPRASARTCCAARIVSRGQRSTTACNRGRWLGEQARERILDGTFDGWRRDWLARVNGAAE